MKTIGLSVQQDQGHLTLAVKKLFSSMAISLRAILALTVAGLAAAAIITLSVWTAGMDINIYLGAATWGLGFILLGLAVDNRGSAALYQMITGTALLLLALLQSSVSPDYFIGSGVLLAGWLAMLVFNRLSD